MQDKFEYEAISEVFYVPVPNEMETAPSFWHHKQNQQNSQLLWGDGCLNTDADRPAKQTDTSQSKLHVLMITHPFFL